jgi:hypothetical protein
VSSRQNWNLCECLLQSSIWQTPVAEVNLHHLLFHRFEVQIGITFNPG